MGKRFRGEGDAVQVLLIVKNVHGSALAKGDWVKWCTTEADGESVIGTSTSARGENACGCLLEAIADDKYGEMVVEGYHPAAKVKGDETNVAVGDSLGGSGTALKSGKIGPTTPHTNCWGVCLEALTLDTTAKVMVQK